MSHVMQVHPYTDLDEVGVKITILHVRNTIRLAKTRFDHSHQQLDAEQIAHFVSLRPNGGPRAYQI